MTKINHQLSFHKALQNAGVFLILLSPLLWLVLWTMPYAETDVSQDYFWVLLSLELFSIIVCACIFIVGWHVLDESRPKASVRLACAFLTVGLLDAAHLFSYQSMPAFISENSPEKTISFWLLARLVAALALLVYIWPATKNPRHKNFLFKMRYLTQTLMGVLLAGIVILVFPDKLPGSLISGSGPGSLAHVIEVLVVGLHMLTLYWLLSKNSTIEFNNGLGLVVAISLMVPSELFFLTTASYTDFWSFLGHIYKAAAYMFLYRAIFLNNISLPVIRLQDAHSSLQYYANQLDELLNNAPDGIVCVDKIGCITFINPRMEEMFGYQLHELVGNKIEILLPIAMRERHTHLRDGYARAPVGRPMSNTRSLLGRCKDGREIPVAISLGFHQSNDGGQITAFIRDVTDRQKLETEMLHRASHDALTGLPNRNLLTERLERAVVHSRRNASEFALIMIDLDNFKDVNDGWGHTLGDQLLITVARRLSRALREGDTVARFGGDEFVILAENLADAEDARPVVNKVLAALSHVFVLGATEFSVTASIGVASYPADADDLETLLSHADIAMYKAKNSGRRTAFFYDDSMGLHQQQETQLKSWLINALEKQEFEVYYQPQYGIHNRDIVGFEALLRWNHPEIGMISPEKFIPVAESSGMIIPITDWVLRQVCAQIRIWADLGYRKRVSVNISALHFRREGVLCRLIETLLDCSGVSPELLGIELTETALMDNPDIVADTLRRIVSLGVHISIDDFGTGYSSLASLQLYPLHTLKIDRSFMSGLTRDSKSAAIVAGLVNLATNLGLEVLAEGVETEEQLAILRTCGCGSIQGWLMSPAITSLECTRLLYDSKRLDTQHQSMLRA